MKIKRHLAEFLRKYRVFCWEVRKRFMPKEKRLLIEKMEHHHKALVNHIEKVQASVEEQMVNEVLRELGLPNKVRVEPKNSDQTQKED